MQKYQPKDLTVARLSVATGEEMKHWVKLTKAAAEADDTKIALKSSGRVKDVRTRLADFFGLDLQAPIISASRSVKKETDVDATIRAKQWEDWHALGDEWVAAVEQKIPFRLQESNQDLPITHDPALVESISRTLIKYPALPTDPIASTQGWQLSAIGRQTVQQWLHAVQQGQDRAALARLRALNDLLYATSEAAFLPLPSSSTPLEGSVNKSHQSSPWALPSSAPLPLLPPSAPHPVAPAICLLRRGDPSSDLGNTGPSTPSVPAPLAPEMSAASAIASAVDSSIAGTSSVSLITLPTASTLPEAIAQCESGLVARIRAAYGPPDGKKGTSSNPEVWASYRVKINRRERLYAILQNDFDGDKDLFFAFFTKATSTAPRGRGTKRSRAIMESSDNADSRVFYAVNDIVDAIPKCRTAVADALRGMDGAGRVSVWGEKNDFEIWRELGLEHYGPKK